MYQATIYRVNDGNKEFVLSMKSGDPKRLKAAAKREAEAVSGETEIIDNLPTEAKAKPKAKPPKKKDKPAAEPAEAKLAEPESEPELDQGFAE